MKRSKKEIYLKEWLLSCVVFLMAFVVLGVRYALYRDITPLLIVQILGSGLICFILPVLKVLLPKIDIPNSINFLIALNIILAMYIGNAMKVYNYLSWWDTFVHGFFGVICTYSLFAIFKDYRISASVFYLLSALGLGAVWEIFEYSCDVIMGSDVQRVQESLDNHKLPQADTMEDLIITLITAFLTVVVVLSIRRFRSQRALRVARREEEIK